MNKILKRILIILIALIGTIITMPKEENAADFSLDNTWSIFENGKGSQSKYFCIDKNSQIGNSYERVASFDFDGSKWTYTDYKNNKRTQLIEKEQEKKDLYRIYYVGTSDINVGEIDEDIGRYVPSENDAQLLMWAVLGNMPNDKYHEDYVTRKYFNSDNNRNNIKYDENNNKVEIEDYSPTFKEYTDDIEVLLPVYDSLGQIIRYSMNYTSFNPMGFGYVNLYTNVDLSLYEKYGFQSGGIDVYESCDPNSNGKQRLINVFTGKRESKFKLNLKKVDESGNKLNNAQFNISTNNIKGSIPTTGISLGEAEYSNLSLNNNSGTITINEVEPPDSTYTNAGSCTFKISYNNNDSTYSIDKATTNSNYTCSKTGNTITITITNKKTTPKDFTFTINKKDNEGKDIDDQNAKFYYRIIANGKTLSYNYELNSKNFPVKSEGKEFLKIGDPVTVKTEVYKVDVWVYEHEAPKNCVKDKYWHKFTYRYNGKEWKLENVFRLDSPNTGAPSDWYNESNYDFSPYHYDVTTKKDYKSEYDTPDKLTIFNEKIEPKPFQLEILKVNKNNENQKLGGAEFSITIKSEGSGEKHINYENLSAITDDENGSFIYTAEKVYDDKIKVTVSEVNQPDGFMLHPGEHYFIYKWDNSAKKWNLSDCTECYDDSITSNEISISSDNNNNEKITITCKDEPRTLKLRIKKYNSESINEDEINQSFTFNVKVESFNLNNLPDNFPSRFDETFNNDNLENKKKFPIAGESFPINPTWIEKFGAEVGKAEKKEILKETEYYTKDGTISIDLEKEIKGNTDEYFLITVQEKLAPNGYKIDTSEYQYVTKFGKDDWLWQWSSDMKTNARCTATKHDKECYKVTYKNADGSASWDQYIQQDQYDWREAGLECPNEKCASHESKASTYKTANGNKVKRGYCSVDDEITLSFANKPMKANFNLTKLMEYGDNKTKTDKELYNAKFKVTITNAKFKYNGKDVSKEKVTYDNLSIGDLEFTDIELRDKSDDKVITVEITETEAPPGYTKLEGTQKFTLKTDREKGKWELTRDIVSDLVTVNGNTSETVRIDDEGTFNINFYNPPNKFDIDLSKVNGAIGSEKKAKSKTVDAKFSISITNIYSLKENGTEKTFNKDFTYTAKDVNLNEIKLTDVILYNPIDNVTITITETNVGASDNTWDWEEKILKDPLTIKLHLYNNTKGKADGLTIDNYSFNNKANNVYAYCALSNGKLTISLANVAIVSKPEEGHPNASISGNVWKDGQIGDKQAYLNGILDAGEEGIEGIQVAATVQIQRLKPVTKYVNFYTDKAGKWWYGFNEGQDEFTSKKQDNDGYVKVKDGVYCYGSKSYIASYEFAGVDEVSVNSDTERYGNYYINLSGILNSYKIERPFDGYNTSYGKNDQTYYEHILGYRVTFTYNGVVYENAEYVNPHQINGNTRYSDATEEMANSGARKALNYKFSEIKNNQVVNANYIDLPYTYSGKPNENNYNYLEGSSSLPTNDPEWNGASGNYSAYSISARTNDANATLDENRFTGGLGFSTSSANQNITNVDLGLVERPADLAIDHNVAYTDVSINGKTTRYNYNDIDIDLAEELNKWIKEALSNSEIVKIHPEDYYFRVSDYSNNIDGSENTLDLMKTDELDVKVTYKVSMFESIKADEGQTDQIKQIVYYYDRDMYTLDKDSIKEYGVTEINSNIDGYNAILIEGSWTTSSGKDPYINITFTVNKDNKGFVKTGEIKNNIAAITSYYINTGKLDIDSSTKAIVNNNKKIEFEDDTLPSKAVHIDFSKEERTISGTVFNDKRNENELGNGKLEEGEAINDVVVQLIEIKNNNEEYIWQETKAGSKEVTSAVQFNAENGAVYKYNNDLGDNATGQYKFINMIPGNYIVRFIYGDGYKYDISVGNTKYNGADYKSTKDLQYKAEWYNTAEYDTNASKARDNEARRLEVMAKTAQIDEGLGTVLDVYARNKGLTELNDIEKTNIINYIKSLASAKDTDLNRMLYEKYYNDYNEDTEDRETKAQDKALDTLDDFSELSELNDDVLSIIKKCIAYKTFMIAETSKINVPVDTSTLKTTESSTGVNYNEIKINFEGVNFGITTKPAIKLDLEKHITALKITPNGTGVQPIVDARANITDILNGKLNTTGETTGLATDKSTRGNRGFWELQTDVEELIQGANLEVEYTYVVTNNGEKDYVSKTLADEYNRNPENYSNYIISTINPYALMESLKGKTNTYGTYLGEYYYTGKEPEDKEAQAVLSRVEGLEEAVNNQLKYDKATAGEYFDKANGDPVTKNVYNTDGILETENINAVVKTTSPTSLLNVGDKDTSKVIKLQSILSSLNTDDTGNIPSYIAEVTKYSSASGGRNTAGTPGNLSYVHSYDNTKTMENSNENEPDEFWGETIIVTKPTGEDRITTMQIAIITVASIATLGVGIVLIKKFAIKK